MALWRGIVLVSPFRAWMVDRHGPRRALPPMAAGFAAVLVAIAVIPARAGVNDAAIAVLAVAAGACAPPLGVVMRTLWSTLIDDRGVLQTAYSLDGVVEELLNVTGPVIAGVLVVAATARRRAPGHRRARSGGDRAVHPVARSAPLAGPLALVCCQVPRTRRQERRAQAARSWR